MKENLGTVYFLKMGGVDGILIVRRGEHTKTRGFKGRARP